jgi:hypothetical protein
VTLGGYFKPHNFAALTSMTFPSIEVMGATVLTGFPVVDFFTGTPLLNTFTFGPSLKQVGNSGWGNIRFTSCALLVASVDHILVRLAALDGTNGTTTFNGRTVTITGTSATPSSNGLAAKATLVSRGCTVTHN